MPVAVALRRHVRARALVEHDQRNAVLARHIRQEEALEPLLRRDVGRPAGDGEVFAAHHHLASVHGGQAADVGQRLEVDEPALLVGAVAGQTADLVEAARVRDRLDPLADRQLAQFVLSADALFAAHFLRQLAAQVEFVHFLLPVARLGSFVG